MTKIPETLAYSASYLTMARPVFGIHQDLEASRHSPMADLLLPSGLTLQQWVDGLPFESLLAMIAQEGVHLAGRLRASVDGADELDALTTAVRAAGLEPERPGRRRKSPSFEGFDAVRESAELFERGRKRLVSSAIDRPVDLRTPWFLLGPPGRGSTAVGQAVADLIYRQRRRPLERPSARYAWQAAKEIDRDPRPTTMLSAAGVSLRTALSVVRDFGYATEHDVSSQDFEPHQGNVDEFYATLAKRRANRVVNMGRDLMSWLAWLGLGKPIVASVRVGPRFLATRAEPGSSVPPVLVREEPGTQLVSHPVLLLGYRFIECGGATAEQGRQVQQLWAQKGTVGDLFRVLEGVKLPVEYLVLNPASDVWGAGGYAYISESVLWAQANEGFGLLWAGETDHDAEGAPVKEQVFAHPRRR